MTSLDLWLVMGIIPEWSYDNSMITAIFSLVSCIVVILMLNISYIYIVILEQMIEYDEVKQTPRWDSWNMPYSICIRMVILTYTLKTWAHCQPLKTRHVVPQQGSWLDHIIKVPLENGYRWYPKTIADVLWNYLGLYNLFVVRWVFISQLRTGNPRFGGQKITIFDGLTPFWPGELPILCLASATR